MPGPPSKLVLPGFIALVAYISISSAWGKHAARYALPSWARGLAAVAGSALVRCVGARRALPLGA